MAKRLQAGAHAGFAISEPYIPANANVDATTGEVRPLFVLSLSSTSHLATHKAYNEASLACVIVELI